MSLAQIRYFIAAAEEGSLARAAARLHVSQPPLTRQLRSLEEEIGAPLLERSSRGVALLPAGNAFLVHARRMLMELDSGVAAARTAATSEGTGERFEQLAGEVESATERNPSAQGATRDGVDRRKRLVARSAHPGVRAS